MEAEERVIGELWGSEEFEDQLTRTFLALYEVPAKERVVHKRGPYEIVEGCNKATLHNLKKKGFMVAHPGRVLENPLREDGSYHIDLSNEPLPGRIAFYQNPSRFPETPGAEGFYAFLVLIQKAKLPIPGFCPLAGGCHYTLKHIGIHNRDGVMTGPGAGFTICPDGRMLPMKQVLASVAPAYSDKDEYHSNLPWLSYGVQTWNDRRFMWNVQVVDEQGKIFFPVYKEEVKSLFYARDLPMTKTGRKAPILHWVSAHRRRLEKGTEVDVRKHLRGADKFEYSGMNFQISQPQKRPGESYEDVPMYL